MERRDQRRASIIELPATQPRDRIHRLQQRLRRELAERHDHARLDDVDLAEQVRLALLDFVGFGIAVAGRPAFDDVGDVDLIAREADGLDDLRQQLSGAADERLTALVFFLAGRLADEHQPRFGVADAKDDLRSAERAQLATTTVLTEIFFYAVKTVVVVLSEHDVACDVMRVEGRGRSPLPPLHIFAHALDTDFSKVAEMLRDLSRHVYALTDAFPPSPRLRWTSGC